MVSWSLSGANLEPAAEHYLSHQPTAVEVALSWVWKPERERNRAWQATNYASAASAGSSGKVQQSD
jgi:hypothetical protein